MPIFPEGSTIFNEGDAAISAYLIEAGEVSVVSQSGSQTVSKGAILGTLSLLQGIPHTDTAVAKSAVTLEPLSKTQLETYVTRMHLSPAGETVVAAQEGSHFSHLASAFSRYATTLEQKLEHLAGGPKSGEPEELPAPKEVKQSDMGPIKPLIDDDSINDILINGPSNIFVERNGLLVKTDIEFKNDREVFGLARTIATDIGRKIDMGRPLLDARLLDGSRVNIIAPPLAVDGTSISIRKFAKKRITLESMVQNENMSNEIAEFLKVVGKCRLNIVISGGTGSGKTTLLNAISNFIDPAERVVTIEDAAELKLQQPHVVRLETRPHHIGMKADEDVTMRDLVKNALRMRPDRIIVGEVRGPEAFDMLQAMNTGHEGSLTTVHSNHPRDALSRMENMISMADLQIPIKSLRYQIASALHLIIQISRMRDGKRRVTYISEIVGMEGDMITMHDLFTYKTEGEDDSGKIVGKFKWSGIVPRFTRRVEYYGEIERLEAALGVKFPKMANVQTPAKKK